MKELIDKLAVHAGYLERYRSGDQRVMAGDIRAAIAALEAAEAKFEEARADNHRMALELADLLCERKELRETINSVAVCQKHVTEITAGACMICEIEQLREQAAQARRTSQYWKDCHIAGNAEIDKLRAQMQEIVLMAARKHRPAYDEQQRVIMELRARIAELEQQVPKCDCWMHVRQVCDVCQGVTGSEKDTLPAAPKEEV